MKRRNYPFRVKALDERGSFSGYLSVFNCVDSYNEEVVPGAFAQTLKEHEEKALAIPLLWMHDDREPIGTFTRAEEDDKGLYVEGSILIDAGATERRAYEHMKAKTVSGLSIGFTLYPGGIEYDSEREVTLLKNINLWEGSVVSFPACEPARIESVKSALTNPRDFERLLRDAGFSRSQAKALMSGGYRALVEQRDADPEELKAVADSITKLTQALAP